MRDYEPTEDPQFNQPVAISPTAGVAEKLSLESSPNTILPCIDLTTLLACAHTQIMIKEAKRP